MTDVAGASPAGNPAPEHGAGDNGQPPVPNALFAELDEATRDWVQTRHEGDVTKLAKQAYELDKFAGSAVQVPKDDAPVEDWNKFYSRLGRPESTDKYEFKVPDNLPETMPYNADLASSFKEKAFEMGLTAKQAANAHDWFVSQQAELATGMQEQIAGDTGATIEQANAAIQKAWGEPSSETYKANLDLAGRFFDAVDEKGGLREVLNKKGLTGPNGEILVPELAFAFAKAGTAIFTEGGTLDASSGDSLAGVNPFATENFNLTKIMALIKTDPDKATLLAKSVGADPREYGLN